MTNPDLMPPILAGILSIYGLVVAVIISGDLKERLPIYSAFLQLGAGISVGLCGLAAGYVIISIPERRRHFRQGMIGRLIQKSGQKLHL